MKLLFLFLFVLSTACSGGKERVYAGSTPADHPIRLFLGIPFADSVDFIRWWITINNGQYILRCNYGISKPNTNGFWNDGKWIDLYGKLTSNGAYYAFENRDQVLNAVEVNAGLLHLLDEKKNMLVGTGGFSYALHNRQTESTKQVNIISKQKQLKDSMNYQGRTLCSNFSINRPGMDCIKMKWSIVFYANTKTNTPTTYILNRNRIDQGKKGTWKIITGKDGRVLYELMPENGTSPTYLLKLDDNILWFTDANGNLLVGNEDFSFALNRMK